MLRVFLFLYGALWLVLTPLVLGYLWWRGRRDPVYRSRISERFGFYAGPKPQGGVWIHAVSLGETRSAEPLIRKLLDRGDFVVLTHFTPAGRSESGRRFADDIAAGRLSVVWVPLDMRWTYRRFLRAFRPRIGLTMEVEIWPAMIFAAKAAGVPLYLCNAQYTTRSIARDAGGLRLRQRVIRGCAGAFVKSSLQARRFADIGVRNITVTGELRFDQPIPPGQMAAAAGQRPGLAGAGGESIAFVSVVEGEDALFIAAMQALRDRARAHDTALPFFIYVPRAPERFDEVADLLAAAGLVTLRRSKAFGAGAAGLATLVAPLTTAPDVLLGDSLGEMYFYLSLADRVVVGGGFTAKGAHNIIEPLSLSKPILTGPQTWTIEYPFAEAEAAGLAISVPDEAALIAALSQPSSADVPAIKAFLAEHSGAGQRTLAAIDAALAANTA